MDSQEALKFINSLFDEKTKPILNELEASIFLGFWEDRTYKEITAKAILSESHVRDTGAKLCKRIKEDLGISVSKRNFKNPIEYRRQQHPAKVLPSQESLPEHSNSAEQKASKQASPSQANPNLAQGQNSITNPFTPQQGRVDNLELFFNQEPEIRRVFEVLNSGSSVALIGEEGIGKSSLLWKICQLAESCLHSPRQSVFLDLNLVHDENDFYSALCHEVGIPESRSMLNRNLRSHRVLLAIDNVGKMTWEGFTRQVRSHLRGLAEGSNAPLKLVLAANEPLGKLFNNSQDESKTSPFTGIFQEENLKAWDEATALAFIDARLAMTSVRFTEEEIIQLVQQSGGHPRQLMQLCYQTYSRYVEGRE